MVISAHNTVYVQTHMAGSTMFTWYDKHQCLQYCLCSDMSERLHSARLACPGGTVLQVRRAWQGMVLGIAVDLSALPYLLQLLPGPTPSRCPGRSFPVGPDRVGREREARKGPAYPWSEERGRSRIAVPPWLGLLVGAPTRSPGRRCRSGTGSWSRPVIVYLGRPRHALSLRRLLGQVLQGSGSIGDLGFMNPTPPLREP